MLLLNLISNDILMDFVVRDATQHVEKNDRKKSFSSLWVCTIKICSSKLFRTVISYGVCHYRTLLH